MARDLSAIFVYLHILFMYFKKKKSAPQMVFYELSDFGWWVGV